MVSESALALVHDREHLPPMGKRGGVLTPVTAFGDVLVQRLNACGRIKIENEILSVNPKEKKNH